MPGQPDEQKPYAFVSHETAILAIWQNAEQGWRNNMDGEGVWAVPAPAYCVKSQRDFKQLAREVDLPSLGINGTPVDLLVPNGSCFSRGKLARFHVWKGAFPPRSFLRVHDRVFVSTPYFIVLQLSAASPPSKLSRSHAKSVARQDAQILAELGLEGQSLSPSDLQRWDNIARLVKATETLCDFAGTYRYIQATKGVVYGTRPLMSRQSFAEYLEGVNARKGIDRAFRVAELAFDKSASPMETALVLMLTLPVELGGFGLPRPELNGEIPLEQAFLDLVSQEAFFADLLWADEQLIVEYYGWKDHFGAGPTKVGRDAARANSLTSLGWTVLHVTYEQVRSVAGISLLARQVAHALGVTLLEPNEIEHVWHSRLLPLLLAKVSDAFS
jgi:hypothetical protein